MERVIKPYRMGFHLLNIYSMKPCMINRNMNFNHDENCLLRQCDRNDYPAKFLEVEQNKVKLIFQQVFILLWGTRINYRIYLIFYHND